LIPEAVTGDLESGSRETFDRHLAGCPKCARRYADLAATVRKFEARPAPDAPPEFWDGYWESLERRMAAEAESDGAVPAAVPSRPRRAFFLRRWAYGAAGAAIILAVGIFIGREIGRRPGPTAVATRAVPRLSEPLALRAAHHLKRSRMLILAVVNTDPGTGDTLGLNLPLQKRTSEALVVEAAALKKEIGGADRRLERLLSDLEIILLQIANLEPAPDTADIEVIRAGVENRDLLFKIRLNEVLRPAEKSGPRNGRSAKGIV
jgi:hypothetical protein